MMERGQITARDTYLGLISSTDRKDGVNPLVADAFIAELRELLLFRVAAAFVGGDRADEKVGKGDVIICRGRRFRSSQLHMMIQWMGQ
jgi:hypothetical protein